MKNNSRTLSKQEAKVILGLEWEDRKSVDREEILRLLEGNVARTGKLIHSLIKKRWLERIAPGRYLLIRADRGLEGIPEINEFALGRMLWQTPTTSDIPRRPPSTASRLSRAAPSGL